MTAFKVVIPARYGSSRLPAKPLLDIAGQPMVAHVYQRAPWPNLFPLVVKLSPQVWGILSYAVLSINILMIVMRWLKQRFVSVSLKFFQHFP